MRGKDGRSKLATEITRQCLSSSSIEGEPQDPEAGYVKLTSAGEWDLRHSRESVLLSEAQSKVRAARPLKLP